MKHPLKMYLHSEGESNEYDLEQEILPEVLKRYPGFVMSEKAKEMFKGALYEVALDVELDLETGVVEIIKVNGAEVKRDLTKLIPYPHKGSDECHCAECVEERFRSKYRR